MKIWQSAILLGLFVASPLAKAVDVVLSGGTALTSWEHLRGASQHDKWWANFIRAATIRIDQLRVADPKARIIWVVFRPSYVARGREDGKDYIRMIREDAAKRGVKLVWADTAQQAVEAINRAPRGGDKISTFTYFGHSNRFAFMLDYSNNIMAASKHWIHEQDIGKLFRRESFRPDADCRSYGCYTGLSMSAKWKESLGMPLLGNTDSTRYYPVSSGRLPDGAGRWVR